MMIISKGSLKRQKRLKPEQNLVLLNWIIETKNNKSKVKEVMTEIYKKKFPN